MTISLNDIRLFACHGVLPDERTLGAWFRVSLSVEADCQKAIDNDDLDGTVNYAEMARIIKEEMDVPSRLLEHLAGRISRRLMNAFPAIEQLTLTVHKEHPPIPMECASSSVTIHLTRLETTQT